MRSSIERVQKDIDGNIVKSMQKNFNLEQKDSSLNHNLQLYATKIQNIIPNLRKELDLRYAYAPTLKQLKARGYSALANEIVKLSKKISHFNYLSIIKKLGLRIKRKWSIYGLDDLGQRLLYDIDTLPRFNSPSHPKYRKLKKGQAPDYQDITWMKYVTQILPYNYYQIIESVGLKPRTKNRKAFKIGDWLDEYEKCRNMLISSGSQTYESDEGPNSYDFTHYLKFCNSYYQGSRRAGLNAIDLGRRLGYEPRNAHKDWSNFSVKDFADVLIEELDSGLRNDLGLRVDEAPRITQLKNNRSDLWSAIKRSDYTYTEILRAAKLKLYLDREGLRGIVGNYIHEILGIELINLTRSLGIQSFKEVLPSKINNANAIDLSFLRFNKFKYFIENNQHILTIPKDIKMINVDYTITNDESYLIEKFYKGYQGKSKILIIVIFDPIFLNVQIPQDVKFKKNIRILTTEDFAHFIAPNNKEFFKFMKMLDILNSSIKRFNDINFLILDDMYSKAKRKLKKIEKIYNFRQRNLEFILRKRKMYNLLNLYA